MHDSTKRPSRGVRWCTVLVVAGLTALLLSGCVGEPAPTPTPMPTAPDAAEPIFASDEEALVAAEAAYRAYSAASSVIAQDGGAGPDRINSTVTAEYAAKLHEEFQALRDSGLAMSGETQVDSVSIVESYIDHPRARVSIYLCRDVTGVRVLDSAGSDVTPPNRENRIPSQVFLVSTSEGSNTLLVNGVDRWSGANFC